MAQGCSICSAPREIQNAVNSQLGKRVPLRKIAAESAFSRASLSRHARACLSRRTLAEHKTLETARLVFAHHPARIEERNHDGRVLLFKIPDMTAKLVYETQGGTIILESQLRDSDCVVEITYEAPLKAEAESKTPPVPPS
jgi:hypothetical protein